MTAILVVDEAAADRELFATVLRHTGYQVLEAGSGEEALRLAQHRQPALIIADILMPTMDGYELVRALRSDKSTARTPVIFSTATYVLEEVRRLATAVGVAHILIKPCDPDEVVEIVNEAMAAPADPVAPLPSEEFHRQHLRLVNAKLLQKVEELRETVLLTGTLQRESDEKDGFGAGREASSRDDLESLLSRRELQVLSMIVDGATNTDIAERLVIATSTVQSHVKRILKKLGVKNRTEAAVRYVRRYPRLPSPSK